MNRNFNKRAFTLTEIMIGFVIVAVAIVPIFALFTQSTKGTGKNKNKVNGMKLAEEKLNYYLNMKYEYINANYITKQDIAREGTLYGVSLEWQTIPSIVFNYKTVRILGGVTQEITKTYDCKNALKRLLINITWKEGSIDKVFTLETHKADVPALKGLL